jgi:ribosomal protein L7/L12
MPKCRFCDHNNPVGADRCQNCGSWIEQAVPSELPSQEPKSNSRDRVARKPDSLEGQIRSLMQAGRKIEAIKIYRQETGSGLKEAKDAVEALAAWQPIAGRSVKSAEESGIDPNSLEGQVLALVQAQKKILAIKVYREQTGVGLKQAKDAVEALAAKHGISPKGVGCAGMVLLVAVVFTIVCMLALLD